MKKRLLIAGVLLLLVATAAIWGAQWVRAQVEIDRCLDRGGRWDHEMERCDTAPEVSSAERNAA